MVEPGARAEVPVVAAPAPWRRVLLAAVGGLVGVGFGVSPEDGRDLVLVMSHSGRGLYDAVTGELLAREETPESSWPEADLSCHGIGPLTGLRVPTAGLVGGTLGRATGDGWSLTVVRLGGLEEQVLLSADGDRCAGPHGGTWWHLHDADATELRAVGFSLSGHTLAVATTADLTLWARP
ncbi:hypothetical protein ACIRBX_25680 [Kitasatospora sp. NPDC096147]|uniref:hypothetical protein n=1 Tax=Kitasatospora sp. NPDC096147 TaxID=3364093 RepID=UPI0038148CA7